jgi:hypothetical protein
MANVPEIREKLASLLSHQISLDDFEQWFAGYSWNIHKTGDIEAQKFAYAIEHQLSQFDDDCEDLRTALTRVQSATGRKAA